MEKENIVELKNISVAFDGEQVLDGLNLTKSRIRSLLLF